MTLGICCVDGGLVSSSKWNYTHRNKSSDYTILQRVDPRVRPSHVTHLLAVLQHTLLVFHTALGSGWVRLPAAGLNVDVHVQLPTEHGHLRLGHGEPGSRVGCQRLRTRRETALNALGGRSAEAIDTGGFCSTSL